MWLPTDWQYPCYNPNNGRIKALFKWRNTYNFIYEEQTKNIIPILSIKRPHSRVFYISAIALLLSFMNWFNLYSFQRIITKEKCDFNNKKCKLDLCKFDNYTNYDCNICYEYKGKLHSGCRTVINDNNSIFTNTYIHNIHLISGIPFRLIYGYLTDRYGIRLIYTFSFILGIIINILMISSLFHNNIIIKIIIYSGYGIYGGNFILSILWIITMFDINIIGISTGIIGAIGNFGIGLIFYLNSYIYEYLIINNIFLLLLLIGWCPLLTIIMIKLIYYNTDDCPYGNNNELKEHSEENIDESIYSNLSLSRNIDLIYSKDTLYKTVTNTKILVIAFNYAMCFGFEISLYTTLYNFLIDKYKLSYRDAYNIPIYYALINLIGRPLGGLISDYNYEYNNVRKKIKVNIFITFSLGILTLIYVFYILEIGCENYCIDMINNNIVLILILLLCNINEGTIFGLFPHLTNNIGFSAGLISSIGLLGGVIGNILFTLNIKYITLYFFGFGNILNSLLLILFLL
jgi:NNP family nitrate/nitrite transporter-like MFS transporter